MLESIKQIVIQAGELIRNAHATAPNIIDKDGPANFVTTYDILVQNFLFERLSELYPHAAFVGEENDTQPNIEKGYAFIIDPIDGTNNFIADLATSSISVALTLDGIVQIGIVYNPFRGELYWAERGKGAYLNGTPLYVQDRPLNSWLVCFDTSPYHPELHDATFLLARKVMAMGTDVRRLGSGATELCYLAADRFVLTYAFRQAPWDYAAAWLIAEEAGAIVTTMEGTSPSLHGPSSILAGNPTAHREFMTLMDTLKKEGLLSW